MDRPSFFQSLRVVPPLNSTAGTFLPSALRPSSSPCSILADRTDALCNRVASRTLLFPSRTLYQFCPFRRYVAARDLFCILNTYFIPATVYRNSPYLSTPLQIVFSDSVPTLSPLLGCSFSCLAWLVPCVVLSLINISLFSLRISILRL